MNLTKENIGQLILGILVISLAGFGVFHFLNKYTPQATYFTYSAQDFSNIPAKDTNQKISKDEILWWDGQVFAEIQKNKTAPTTASKIYAYLTVSQNDFAAISKNKNHDYDGSVSAISADVICKFFPDDCHQFENFKSKDSYSNKLADVVIQKIEQRIQSDSPQKVILKSGDNLWYGDNPQTVDAGNWKTWQVSSVDQFLAPVPPVLGTQADLDQLLEMESQTSGITSAKKSAVLFWSDPKTPAGIWLTIASNQSKNSDISLEKFLAIRENLATTLADTYISTWRSKFTYMRRSPFMRNYNLTTLVDQPNVPSYVSDTSAVAGASVKILDYYFPNQKFDDSANEAKNSAIWSGINFPIDTEAGFDMGSKIADVVIANNLSKSTNSQQSKK